MREVFGFELGGEVGAEGWFWVKGDVISVVIELVKEDRVFYVRWDFRGMWSWSFRVVDSLGW